MMSRTLVITGARKGLGRAMAESFLADGWRVAGCSRQESDLQHDHYRHFCLDVIDERRVRRMLRDVHRDWQRLDAVVNNAGIASMNHSLLTPTDGVRRILETNVLGAFVVSREAAKLMGRAGKGRIVNMTSVAVPLHVAGEAAYAASKAAVESLTRTLALELAPLGVTVNAVGPGPIDTDLIRGVPEEKIQQLIQRQAIQRFGTVADVVNVVRFYLSETSNFITGQVLYLGGVF